MPRKAKGFPEISSMPSFRIDYSAGTSRAVENIPMRSIETENLKNLPPTSSPYSKSRSSEFMHNAARWTPISISSESSDEDEKRDKVDSSLRGKALWSSLTSDNVAAYHRFIWQDLRSKQSFVFVHRLSSVARSVEERAEHVGSETTSRSEIPRRENA